MNDPHQQSEPSRQPGLSVPQQAEINRVCTAFEDQWRGAANPRIEEYLDRVDAALRAALLTELIASEIDLRQAAGEDVDVDAYRRRFPDDRAAVDAGWALIANREVGDGGIPSTLCASKDAKLDTDGVTPAASPLAGGAAKADAIPSHIGRYRVVKLLGEGGFGRVYLAEDPQLQRQVALKVPRRKWLSSEKRIEAMLHEARSAARLKHPALVVVHDVQQDGDNVYIVQEYVDGQDLRHWAKSNRPPVDRIVRLMIEVAEAIGFAHQQDLVHRDLKPGNILIDRDGHAHVADFGLALHESLRRSRQGEVSGTPAYMSPEQVRGETHRLDGRSDIWSLGVILYELLGGRRPFRGDTQEELFDEIKHGDPKPLRQIKPELPSELERIGLKCLEKRRTARYSSAAGLIDDLQVWLDLSLASHPPSPIPQPPTPHPAPRVVPKGLRSFDAGDADFFLQLLPGPRDRDGLPESIRFWKTRIEQTDPENTFAVGLIYGPSGCGKSSLVKAGLLPRLASHVTTVYVEATPEDTEVRLIKGLRRHVDGIPDDVELPELLAGLREGQWTDPGRKTLIVLDQFEQWLHANRAEQDTQLVQALRHCDGRRVQCVVLVRDDFWMPATRFLRDLEIRLLEGENSTPIDLFDPLHARKVLTEFGRAYDRLPDATSQQSKDQSQFLDRAIDGLVRDGKIICVRLALFADMLKGKPWNTTTLAQVGGTEGLGVTFLDETFSASTAPAAHRYHQKATQAVLKALLPETGTAIKGSRRSYADLLEVSGYVGRQDDFQDLIRMLDSEIRLITPTVPEGEGNVARQADSHTAEGERNVTRQAHSGVPVIAAMDVGDGKCSTAILAHPTHTAPVAMRYYQLTHDYLVPSLRDWLTRKQKETRRGRAELRLIERAAQWNTRPENRHLPKAWEDLNIRLFSRKKNWTEPQRKMMRKSGLAHGIRTLVVAGLLLAATITGVKIRNSVLDERQRVAAENLEKQNATRAAGLVTALLKADIQQVPAIVKEMADYRQWIDPLLKTESEKAEDDSPEKLKIALALLPVDSSRVEYLYKRLLAAAPNEVTVVRDALLPHKKPLVARLWAILQGVNDVDDVDRVDSEEKADGVDRARQLRAACALAVMDGTNPTWQQVSDDVARQVVHVRPAFVSYWQRALEPVKDILATSLADACHDPALSSTERTLATDLLADYAADTPELLAGAIQYADDNQFGVFCPLIEAQPALAIPVLQSCLAKKLAFDWQDPPLDPAWTAPDASVVQEIQNAQGVLAERFAFCQTMPLVDFQRVAESLRPCGYRPRRVRPYAAGKATQVAAIWTRDGMVCQMKTGSTDEIRAENKRLEADKWQAIDIAGFVAPGSDGKQLVQFAALWTQSGDKGPAHQLLVGLPSEQWSEVQPQLDKAGLKQIDTYNIVTTPENKTLVSVICGKADKPSTLYDKPGVDYSGDLHVGLLQTDVGVGRATKPDNTHDRLTQQLDAAEKTLATKPDDVSARLNRARANYRLGNDKQALEDLDWMVAKQKDPSASWVHKYRALVLARMGKKEDAEKALGEFQKLSTIDGSKAFTDLVVAAHLGSGNEAVKRLEAGIGKHEKDVDFLIWTARAYSAASQVVDDPKTQTKYAQRAVALIQNASAGGYKDYAALRTDVDLEPIRSNPGFMKLLSRGGLDRRYTAVWRESVVLESTEVHGLSPADQLARCKDLIEQGYRPASIAVCNFNSAAGAASTPPVVGASPDPPTPPAEGLPVLETATLWHRPLIPEAAKELLAKRQTNAAVALLKLNKTSAVWPVLRHSPEPRARSYLIHRLRPLEVDPQILAARLLDTNEEISVRRALALCLGEYDMEQLPTTERDTLVKTLMAMYQEHPDAGLHAAVRWLLCQWGHQADVLKLETTLVETEKQRAAREPTDRRRWYVTTQGQTMAVIQGGPFLMGSPSTDPDRDPDEVLHRKTVGRRFALSTTEVTRDQWRRFLKQSKDKIGNYVDSPQITAVVRTEDSPMVAMTWYEAVAYCNWLSQQEGIPEDQWCYERNKDGNFAAGMRPRPGYLSLVGYRLPSEAEWEYACRAGATTVRYFGQTDALLSAYAWYEGNSSKRTWPVGMKKPNDFGLFDMHGDVWDWCHNRSFTDGTAREDAEDTQAAKDSKSRVLRGGSFNNRAPNVRCALRYNNQPNLRTIIAGFHVARTYP